MNKIAAVIVTVLIAAICVACSNEDPTPVSESTLAAELSQNSNWPYVLDGVLEIVEAGGYENSEYPSWAVGSLVTSADIDGVAINIGANVVEDARIDIDSGQEVTVWLGAPEREYGELFYPVKKIRAK